MAFAEFLHNLGQGKGAFSPQRAIDWVLGLAAPHVGIKVDQEVFTDQDYTDNAALLLKKPGNTKSCDSRLKSDYGAGWKPS